MATTSLNRDNVAVNDGLDSIVNCKVTADLPGGAFLNAQEWQEPILKAGHVIIRHNTTKECAPLDVTSGSYVSLPENYSYFGTLRYSVKTNDPQAAVVLEGVINESACPYAIPSAFKTAVPAIRFI